MVSKNTPKMRSHERTRQSNDSNGGMMNPCSVVVDIKRKRRRRTTNIVPLTAATLAIGMTTMTMMMMMPVCESFSPNYNNNNNMIRPVTATKPHIYYGYNKNDDSGVVAPQWRLSSSSSSPLLLPHLIPSRRSSTTTATTSTTTSSRRMVANQFSFTDLMTTMMPSDGDTDNNNNNSNNNNTNILSSWFQELKEDDHISYLKRHQIVKKRRVFKRSMEIFAILSGQIVRPLLCSAVTMKPDLANIHIPNDDDWDAFWAYRKGGGKGQDVDDNDDDTTSTSTSTAKSNKKKNKKNKIRLSNAERVAKGISQLGPTFVKLGQMVGTRPDILHGPLAEALTHLQDNVAPFDNLTAKRIIRNDLKKSMVINTFNKEGGGDIDIDDTGVINNNNNKNKYLQSKEELQQFLDSLSDKPIAAASIAQVYKGYLPGYGPVAVKVQRPGIRKKVERDATLFHSVATVAESVLRSSASLLPNMNNDKVDPSSSLLVGAGSSKGIPLVPTVDEFTARVLEDMDFRREAANMKAFSKLYDLRQPDSSDTVRVLVPELLEELSSDRVLVMEWLEGTKLTDVCNECDDERRENLVLMERAIECTISQMIDHGVLHGEPHAANLLKIRRKNENTGKSDVELGYLDFGLVSYIPKQIRDGIVCAVVQIVFARNIEAVADLCVDLGLLPKETLEIPSERSRFVNALKDTLDEILVWPTRSRRSGRATEVPKIRFDKLVPAMTNFLVQGFDFTIPPYFLNNIRALATLEGIALKLDPDFNILQVIYPYSINRMMRNPSVSKPVTETFLNICRSPETKLISPRKVSLLLNDWALLTGYRKRKIAWDLFISAGGRRVAPVILRNWALNRARNVKGYLHHIKRVVQRVYYWKVSLLVRALQRRRALAIGNYML